jgi:hypothetical protein
MVVKGTLAANQSGFASVGAVSANRAMFIGQREGVLTALCAMSFSAEYALLPGQVTDALGGKQMKTIATIVLGLGTLCAPVLAQDQKPTTTDAATTSGPVTPCTERECEKRDTARLFLIAGKPDAALRVLCTTAAAQDGFRESDSKGKDEDNFAASQRCKQSVGVAVKK